MLPPRSSASPLFAPDLVPGLRNLPRIFADRGYTPEALAATGVLGSGGQPVDAAGVLDRTREPSPFHTLVRLFMLGVPVPRPEADAALAPLTAADLARAGLLRDDGPSVGSVCALVPVRTPAATLLMPRDFDPSVTGRPMRPDHVPGVGLSSILLADLTPRRSAETVLDVGTGSGCQAILAAGHARRVIGTDINPRALDMAHLAVALNGAAGVEFRSGALFAPVAPEGAAFDLVVANPPFVLSPGAQAGDGGADSLVMYRDSGQAGDRFCESLIRGAPALLREVGYAVVLCDWGHARPDDWARRPGQWVRADGAPACDAWIVRWHTVDPASYTDNWTTVDAALPDEVRRARRAAWLAYYRDAGIGAISSGAVILRRRATARPWLRTDTAPLPNAASPGPCSAQIQRIFAGQTFLEEFAAPRALLDQRFTLIPSRRLTRAGAGDAILQQTDGLPWPVGVDGLVWGILRGCDGQRPLRDTIARVAAQVGAPADPITSQVLPIIWEMVRQGYLTPAGR